MDILTPKQIIYKGNCPLLLSLTGNQRQVSLLDILKECMVIFKKPEIFLGYSSSSHLYGSV